MFRPRLFIFCFSLFFSLVCRLIHVHYRLSNNLQCNILNISLEHSGQTVGAGFLYVPIIPYRSGFPALPLSLTAGLGRFRSVRFADLIKTIKSKAKCTRGARRPFSLSLIFADRRRTLSLQTHCRAGCAQGCVALRARCESTTAGHSCRCLHALQDVMPRLRLSSPLVSPVSLASSSRPPAYGHRLQ